MSTGQARRADALREALTTRVVVADGAMGTMLQAQEPTLEDFQNLEGCNEILNVTRPDIVRSVHEAYVAVGVDCVETNTFGANHSALGEYDIPERVHELSEAGARVARESADAFTARDGRPRWVLGSMGPGTKLPTLGHAPYPTLRDAYQRNAEGLVAGGADALLVETTQDLLQTKAAVLGARRALDALGLDLPVIVSVTVETTGTMLLGSEIGAALTALEPLGIDMIGLNCATGPAEMSEHLRYLARHARVPLSCMPNAGLPVLGRDGAHYPLSAPELADARETFVREYGLSLVGGCCGTTPEHLRQVVERVRGLEVPVREPRPEPGAASLYQAVPFRQDTSYLAIGERTNANGSKKFREAMLAGRWDDCVEMAREQIREGAHMLDLCVDYVGRDGVADMEELAGRFATASTLPVVLDSPHRRQTRRARSETPRTTPAPRTHHHPHHRAPGGGAAGRGTRPLRRQHHQPRPHPPFLGTRVIKGIGLKEYATWLDEDALFKGQWGLKQARTGDGPTYEELAENEGRPRLRGLLDRLHTDNLLEAAVVYGYFPCVSKDDDLIVLDEHGNERTRFTFPRQRRGRRLCLGDYFRPQESGETDIVGFQVVTVGSRIGEETAHLFAANAYRDYLELHGLSVQLAEALAEYWHARVRAELGFAAEDPDRMQDMFALKYRGARFSLGYGACPDLEDRAKIADLLRPERIGVHLSEEFQLHPEQSTDAIVIHHPEATYFNAR
ncbi:hypothetical protein ACE1SV_61790 [Streptomyces sp. E-15]